MAPLISVSILIAPATAFSTEYEALVIKRQFSSNLFPAVASDISPTDAAASGVWSGSQNASGAGIAIAESGSAIATISLNARGNGGGIPTASAEGAVVAIVEVDDIVITGPDAMVDVSMNIEWGGVADVVESGVTSVATVDREIGYSLREPVTNVCNTGFGNVGVSGANVGPLSTSTFVVTCPTGMPLQATIRFEIIATARARFSDTTSVEADSSNGASFATVGPVFNIPAGFTANSLDGNIVDNVYVPEPQAMGSLLAGIGLLAQLARRGVRLNSDRPRLSAGASARSAGR